MLKYWLKSIELNWFSSLEREREREKPNSWMFYFTKKKKQKTMISSLIIEKCTSSNYIMDIYLYFKEYTLVVGFDKNVIIYG